MAALPKHHEAKIQCTALAGALALIIFCAWMQVAAGDAGDKGWMLLAARMLTEGKGLYTGVFEVNPPLVFWLYEIPARLSHVLPLADYHILSVLGLVASCAVILLCNRLIAHHPEFAEGKARRLQFALLLAFILIVWTQPVYFFDREYMFFLFALPYVLRFMPSLARVAWPVRLRVTIALLAALGFCIKPHCAVVFAGIQLVLLLRERRLKAVIHLENVIICGIAMLYLFVIWQVTPEYLGVIIPIARQTYSAYSRPLNGLLYAAISFLLYAAMLADFRPCHVSPFRRDIFYLLALSPFYLLYALVNNGWGYTYQPLLNLGLLITGWLWWEYRWLKHDHAAHGLPVKRFVFGARACDLIFSLTTLIAGAIYTLSLITPCDKVPQCRMEHQLAQAVTDAHADSFAMMAATFQPWPAVARISGAELKTRFYHLWMLPKFVVSDEAFAARDRWITDYVAKALAEDLDSRPGVVFVDSSPEYYLTRRHLDLVKYFSSWESFRNAFAHYRYRNTIDFCDSPGEKKASVECRYDVYERMQGDHVQKPR